MATIDGMITVAEASELAGCSAAYINRLLREKRLAGVRVTSRMWLVSKADILKLRKTLSTRAGKRKAV